MKNGLSHAVEICGHASALAFKLSQETGKQWQCVQVKRWLENGLPMQHWSSIPAAIERITGVPVETIIPAVTWNRNEVGVPVSYTVATN